MQFLKNTSGVVEQTFNIMGEITAQRFIAGDEVTYQTSEGDKINEMHMPLCGRESYPFDMVQPGKQPGITLQDASEQIQHDLACVLDGFNNRIVNAACQSVVDNLAKVEANNPLIEAVTNLLSSGDDTGCDGLVVVGRADFMKLRAMVRQLTGNNHGNVNEDDEEEVESTLGEVP